MKGSAGDSIKEAVERAIQQSVRSADNLTKLRYRELIGDEEFVRQRETLIQEQAELKQRLQQLDEEKWIELSQRLFLFSNRAIFWLLHGSIDEKRLVFATIGSNSTLTSKNLSIYARKPFAILQPERQIRDWCPREESNFDYKIRNLASYPLNDEGI